MKNKELVIHLQTSTGQQLKFGGVEVVSSHILSGMWLIIHAEIKVKHKWA